MVFILDLNQRELTVRQIVRRINKAILDNPQSYVYCVRRGRLWRITEARSVLGVVEVKTLLNMGWIVLLPDDKIEVR